MLLNIKAMNPYARRVPRQGGNAPPFILLLRRDSIAAKGDRHEPASINESPSDVGVRQANIGAMRPSTETNAQSPKAKSCKARKAAMNPKQSLNGRVRVSYCKRILVIATAL